MGPQERMLQLAAIIALRSVSNVFSRPHWRADVRLPNLGLDRGEGMMTERVRAEELKEWLSGEDEIALLDVREHGQYGERHLFFAVSLPYSRFELGLPALVPNTNTRLVLCDNADGVADRAAARAATLGYRNLHVLSGGVEAWGSAGYTLYAGVNVPSKTFGELVEHERHTPRLTAQELQALREAGDDIVIVDGRTFAEFQKMNIPGGTCCPNGELALRVGDLAPDPKTKIIVNCAGRTRSIIGAQTLIDFGVPNPVFALENGTQGWFLAGLELENGASRRYSDRSGPVDLGARKERARILATARGVAFVSAEQVNRWLQDTRRTTYLLDVRTPEEFAASSVPGFVHAPGGQLVQATDQWIGTRGARIVLVDNEQVRAPMTAQWLRQLGHEAYVLEGGIAAAAGVVTPRPASRSPRPDDCTAIAPLDLAQRLRSDDVLLIDLRSSTAYRKEHIGQALWSIRSRIAATATDRTKTVVLVTDQPGMAALAALDLQEAGFRDVRQLAGSHEAAREAGLPVVATPDAPTDEESIDFLFFTNGRHEGNADAARQYLAWEIGLVDQLDAQERATFSLPPSP
jgi:rhodanese-related sulfurtransferase